MKRSIFLIVCVCLSFFISAYAQESMPQAFSYQAIARDVAGKVLSEKQIGVKVEILKGSVNGSVVFAETHAPTSAKTGTINLLIGQGTSVQGSFAGIDWASGPYFLQLSMDVKGGTTYEKVSTTQMMPVPYALYAAKAGTALSGGGSSSGNTAKFVLIMDDDDDSDRDEFYNMIAGNELETESHPLYGFRMYFSIVYLDGIDQELDGIIEGWPEGTLPGNYDYFDEWYAPSPSTPMGRRCKNGAHNIPEGIHELKLVIKNKAGVALKEYPFTINAKKER